MHYIIHIGYNNGLMDKIDDMGYKKILLIDYHVHNIGK